MKAKTTAHNRTVTVRRRRRLGYEKPQSAQAPLCGFVSTTFWGGVIAAQCPIAAPKRQLQPER
jgi:hypothetical protein